MSETSSAAVVDRFSRAWPSGDFETARSLLADDLDFEGPIDRFHRAEDYLNAIRGLQGMLKGVEHQATVAQGDDVVHFYVLDTPMGRAPVAEWFTVNDGRITRLRAYFDARPFAPPHG
jgi:ketosteroid isomerase-like protein